MRVCQVPGTVFNGGLCPHRTLSVALKRYEIIEKRKISGVLIQSVCHVSVSRLRANHTLTQ